MAQGIAGGSSDAAVAGLFLWIYGWVGIAILSALVFPVWEWLDPFATLHDAGAWVLRRLGVRGWEPSPLPRRARLWPAVAGFAFVVWLELAAVPGNAELTVVLAGYTVLTLALMAQYGRDPWRAHGETFTVWFRTLNRLAAMGVAPAAGPAAPPGRHRRPVDPPAARSRRACSREPGSRRGSCWSPSAPARSCTTACRRPSCSRRSSARPRSWPGRCCCSGSSGSSSPGALYVARTVSPGAIGAGLLPIAVGYLVAHYLTYLLIDGQGIVIAVSDPLQQGWDLFGTAFYEPSGGLAPAGPRLDRAARGRRGRAHARRLGGARAGAARPGGGRRAATGSRGATCAIARSTIPTRCPVRAATCAGARSRWP